MSRFLCGIRCDEIDCYLSLWSAEYRADDRLCTALDLGCAFAWTSEAEHDVGWLSGRCADVGAQYGELWVLSEVLLNSARQRQLRACSFARPGRY